MPREAIQQNYLLAAVDKLTLQHPSRVVQSRTLEIVDAEGEVTRSMEVSCVSVVDHDPLLLQLRGAVMSSTGSKGASSDGSARIPLNPTADALFVAIARQINAWYRRLPNAREERHIHERLRDWYIDFENRRRAGKLSEVEDLAASKVVEGWARSIEAMFDPPTVLEITEEGRAGVAQPTPCPVCGGRYAIDVRNGDRVTALIVEYRNLGLDTMEHATGLCRSCEEVWHGSGGLRAMRWAIDHTEPPTWTVEGLTVRQLVLGAKAGLSERNMKAAASLLALLARLEPERARVLRKVAARIEAMDKAERARRTEKESTTK